LVIESSKLRAKHDGRVYELNECAAPNTYLYPFDAGKDCPIDCLIMNNQEKLPINLRQKAYSFSLFVYETFEALPERGILVQDIESGVNRLLAKIASYAVSNLKDRLIKDIVSEIRAVKVLLGIVRDISLLERHPALELFSKITELESIFGDLLVGSDPTVRTSLNSTALGVSDEPSDEPSTDTSEDSAVPDDTNHAPAEQAERLSEKEMEYSGEPEPIKPSQPIATDQPENTIAPVNFVVSARQEAIVEVLKRRDKVSVGELARLFSGRVGGKTLQRDLQDLIEKGRVLRHGDRRWTVYSLTQA